MIEPACPVIVLDDERAELWSVSHGLASCGVPVMSHLVRAGELERRPANLYTGVRLLFTDLHLLGPTMSRPEQYISALIKFVENLLRPSIYVMVFWSKFSEEVEAAKAMVNQRIKPELRPIGFASLPKELASRACDDDESVSQPARDELRQCLDGILNEWPQLRALMDWEAAVSQAACTTTNQLFEKLPKGHVEIADSARVRAVLARMAQEALGFPFAFQAASKGMSQALFPILQDCLERAQSPSQENLTRFLNLTDDTQIPLPDESLKALLNDFFIHAEGDVSGPLDRGAVVRLDAAYLSHASGLSIDMGIAGQPWDWREAVCQEFHFNWKSAKATEQGIAAKAALSEDQVYAVELSALCDHVQNKQRSQRFLFAIFAPSSTGGSFYSKNKGGAHDALYVTPEITIGNVPGRLLISCRVFFSRPFGAAIVGVPITRLRKDVIDELSHLYSSHIRRPGKIAFF